MAVLEFDPSSFVYNVDRCHVVNFLVASLDVGGGGKGGTWVEGGWISYITVLLRLLHVRITVW